MTRRGKNGGETKAAAREASGDGENGGKHRLGNGEGVTPGWTKRPKNNGSGGATVAGGGEEG